MAETMTAAEAAEMVAQFIEKADAALGEAIQRSARLIDTGIEVARRAGVHSLAIADAVRNEITVMHCLGDAVMERKTTHEALHAILEKLAIPTPKSGGGGGK